MSDFVVVANRLPVAPTTEPDGSTTWEASPGGLVTALTPVLLENEGAWVGWAGTREGDDAPPEEIVTDNGLHLYPVELSEYDYENFYEGFSNGTLWPLHHSLIVPPKYDTEWWESFREVNHRYAIEAANQASEGAIVWVQDYQLMLVPGILRQLRPDVTIGFFLHIPFPPPEIFRQIPWREELVRGLLGSDLIGFHLDSFANNFLELCANVSGSGLPHTGLPAKLKVEGRSSVRVATATVTAPDGRPVRVASFPISIDSPSVMKMAEGANPEQIREDLGNPKHMLLGVDRLDYTKGIHERLESFEELLESGAIDPAETVLVQVATPSRERVDDYRRMRIKVEQTVGRINGLYGSLGKPVIHYLHRNLPFQTLIDLYTAADVMVVTPLRDGMNLVAKEYVACHADYRGALVLSEFTGAADELDGAFLCNPHDIESVKRAIMAATNGSKDDLQDRMKKMYEQVRDHDVHLWADSFLSELRR